MVLALARRDWRDAHAELRRVAHDTDHVRMRHRDARVPPRSELRPIRGRDVGFPRALEPRLNEAIMNTMNSVNTCPYCTGLHGELGRMAGINSYAIVEGGAMMVYWRYQSGSAFSVSDRVGASMPSAPAA